ncbi:unnamed protein product [Aspergillus oryzae]|nr:unnamed protein product [Aspergillus oryzae]
MTCRLWLFIKGRASTIERAIRAVNLLEEPECVIKYYYVGRMDSDGTIHIQGVLEVSVLPNIVPQIGQVFCSSLEYCFEVVDMKGFTLEGMFSRIDDLDFERVGRCVGSNGRAPDFEGREASEFSRMNCLRGLSGGREVDHFFDELARIFDWKLYLGG